MSKSIIIFIFMIATATFPFLPKDNDALVVKELGRMLILDNGRIKPLATYARFTLFRFSGRYSAGKFSATELLCKMIFDSSGAADYPVFLVNNPDVAYAIGIEPQKKRRYSYNQIKPGLANLYQQAHTIYVQDEHALSAVDNEILRTAINVELYHELCCSFSKGDSATDILKLIPVMTNSNVEWKSLNSVLSGSDSASAQQLINANQLYRHQSFDSCAALLRTFNEQVRAELRTQHISIHPELENTYNSIDPFAKARILYFAALILCFASFLTYAKTFRKTALILMLPGFLLHTFGIIARSIIMQRAPVATMFETFVFVAWLCVAFGVFFYIVFKKNFGTIVAAFCGAAFLFCAQKFGAESDTMGMLAPVLNNNFWLASHIITISMGYAGIVIAGVLAHLYLVQRIFSKTPDNKTSLSQLATSVKAVFSAGFVFTIIGTLLGGMWADMAWGRFWGWDPKENGALLIIIWCTIVIHARTSKLVRETGTAVCAIIGLMLVCIAWLGVNLLGVGMHSYGFTSAGGGILFCILGFEILFLIICAIYLHFSARTQLSNINI